jgi:hypothetical protein
MCSESSGFTSSAEAFRAAAGPSRLGLRLWAIFAVSIIGAEPVLIILVRKIAMLLLYCARIPAVPAIGA